jgi:DNA ligase (NAD+)
LSEHFGDIDSIMNATLEDYQRIDGFGSILAQSAFEFFSLESTKNMIGHFKELGLNLKSLKEVKDNRFQGKTFVLTGTLPTLSRKEASDIIESFGGKTSSSVSKKTSFVLAGEEAGSKLEKANALGIKVITEQELFDMIK